MGGRGLGGRRCGNGGAGGGGRSINTRTPSTFRKEVGISKKWIWGEISGGRKDQGFGWGKIRDGGEQLF